MHVRVSHARTDRSDQLSEFATIVIGGLILALAIIGSFMPDSGSLPIFTVNPVVR